MVFLLAAFIGAASSAATLAINACDLLDAADIQKELGVAVEPGERRDAGMEPNGAYSSSCV